MDDLLEKGTLREVKAQFWERYEVKYLVEVYPAEQLLSHCYRGMEKYPLTNYVIRRVKTSRHQVTNTRKMKKVSFELCMCEDESRMRQEAHGMREYHSRWHTYILALPTDGASQMQGAQGDEAFGSNVDERVEVPRDVLQDRHSQTYQAATLVQRAAQLTCLEERDIDEHAARVSQYRREEDQSSQVIQPVMGKRGALRDTPTQATATKMKGTRQHQQYEAPRITREREQHSPAGDSLEKMTPGSWVREICDKTALCRDFNKGKGDIGGRVCSQGVHRSAKVLRSGRPCRITYHGAGRCRNHRGGSSDEEVTVAGEDSDRNWHQFNINSLEVTQCYDGCSPQGVGTKKRRVRHDVEESWLRPDMYNRHGHHPQGRTPQASRDGETWHPSNDEAEYIECLVVHAGYDVSTEASRMSGVRRAVLRYPPVECTGNGGEWLAANARALEGWAIIPRALAVRLDTGEIARKESMGIILSRHQKEGERRQKAAINEAYAGQEHRERRQEASRWEPPFATGQQGTNKGCLIMPIEDAGLHRLVGEIGEQAGKRPLSDSTKEMPCAVGVHIVMIYYAQESRSLEPQPEYAKPRGGAAVTPGEWALEARSSLAAAREDWLRTMCDEGGSMVRQPPLSLAQVRKRRQQILTETPVGFLPVRVFQGESSQYSEDVVDLPVCGRSVQGEVGRGIPPEYPKPTSQVEKTAAKVASGAEGVQLRVVSHRAALPPQASPGPLPDEHFVEAIKIVKGAPPAGRTLSNEVPKFAAAIRMDSGCMIRQHKDEAAKAVGMLKHGWRPVEAKLRKTQQGGIRQVATAQDRGWLILRSIVTPQPEHTVGEQLVYDSPEVHHCEGSGASPRGEVTPSKEVGLLGGAAEHDRDILPSMHPWKVDVVILEKSMVYTKKEDTAQPISQEDLVKHIQEEELRSIGKPVTAQSDSKQGIIDEAVVGVWLESVWSWMKSSSRHRSVEEGVSSTSAYSDLICRVCNSRDGESFFVTCQNPHGCGRAVHRQKCSVYTGLGGHRRWMCWLCYDIMVNPLDAELRDTQVVEVKSRLATYLDDATPQDWKREVARARTCVVDPMRILSSPWADWEVQASDAVEGPWGWMHDASRAEERVPISRLEGRW